MENTEFEKAKSFIIADILDYAPNSITTRTLIKRNTGHVCVVSFDAGEVLGEKISRFDVFIQILEGNAEIIIDHVSHKLSKEQAIIIPAHSSSSIKANERFRMMSTIIKSGYDL
jgi:quercetin dioxygenase-like cupin family protein